MWEALRVFKILYVIQFLLKSRKFMIFAETLERLQLGKYVKQKSSNDRSVMEVI